MPVKESGSEARKLLNQFDHKEVIHDVNLPAHSGWRSGARFVN
jgi:hypothetical protein